jgi:hypothetical protein
MVAAATAHGAQSSLTTSSIAAALSRTLNQGVPARSSSSGTIENSFLNSGVCEPTKAFSLDQVAREFKQFFIELGTWQGNMTSTTPVMVDAHMWLNTTSRWTACTRARRSTTAPRSAAPFTPASMAAAKTARSRPPTRPTTATRC